MNLHGPFKLFLSSDGRVRARHGIRSVAARGRRPEWGPQEAVKAKGKPSVSPVSYAGTTLGTYLDWKSAAPHGKSCFNLIKPAPESQFDDVPDLEGYTAINHAMSRVE